MFDLAFVFLSQILGFVTDSFVIAATTQELADGFRNFAGPLILIACGIAALGFLWQRQFTQMLIFIIIAILVLAIFYAPEFLANIGTSFGNSNSDLTWE